MPRSTVRPDPKYCEDQAVLCDDMAAAARDPRLAAEWRLMAQDWRSAGLASANDNRLAAGTLSAG